VLLNDFEKGGEDSLYYESWGKKEYKMERKKDYQITMIL